MPKLWLYYIALCMPLLIRVLILDLTFVEWLWYQGYQDSYYFFSALRVNPYFKQFVGGLPLPLFILTVFSFWMIETSVGNEDMIEFQFLLLPVFYIPFTVIGDFLMTLEFHAVNLFAHPVIIIPFGYLYVMIWVVFVRVMERFNLVLT